VWDENKGWSRCIISDANFVGQKKWCVCCADLKNGYLCPEIRNDKRQYKFKGLFGFDSKVNGYCKHVEPRDMPRKSGSQNKKWRKYLRSCSLIEFKVGWLYLAQGAGQDVSRKPCPAVCDPEALVSRE